MAPKKNRGKGLQVDLSEMAFRPPPLGANIVLPPPSPPQQPTTAAGTAASAGSLSALPPPQPFPSLGGTASAAAAGGGGTTVDSGSRPDRSPPIKPVLYQQQRSQQQQQHKVLFHHTTNKEAAYLQSKKQQQHRVGGNKSGSALQTYSSSGSSSGGKLSERLLYVLNTYQFVLNPAALVPQVHSDVIRAMSSFDEFPCWSHICAVVLRGDFEDFICPCCLSTPVAPRMALDGHVFCARCWVQYTNERVALAVRQGKDASAAAMVPCPVCSTLSPASITKPVLFVPRSSTMSTTATTAASGNNKAGEEVEFTRLQRLRTAPLFFKPASGSKVRGNSPDSSPVMRPEQAGGMLSSTAGSTAGTMLDLGEAAVAASHEKPATTATTTTSTTTSSPCAALSTLLPRLQLECADDVTTCSRYVAFDAAVLEQWAAQQLRALQDEKFQIEGSLAAILCATGGEHADKSPMALALSSELEALETAMEQLMTEMALAAAAPPMPPRSVGFTFPRNSPSFPSIFNSISFAADGCSIQSSATDVVDIFRGSCPVEDPNLGTAVQVLFLHPLSLKMLQEDALSRGRPPPDSVRCRVDDVEPVTQSGEQRKRNIFAHIPLGATFHIAFADLRPRLLPHVAHGFDQAVEDRREKIRRFVAREAEQALKMEKYAAAMERVHQERTSALVEQFALSGGRTDSNSTSLMDDDEIARRNMTAFASGLEAIPGGSSSNKKKKAGMVAVDVAQLHRNMPSLDSCWSKSADDDDDDDDGYHMSTSSSVAGIAAANHNNANDTSVLTTSASSANSSGIVLLSPNSAVLSGSAGKVLDLSAISAGSSSSAAGGGGGSKKKTAQQNVNSQWKSGGGGGGGGAAGLFSGGTPPQSPPAWSTPVQPAAGTTKAWGKK